VYLSRSTDRCLKLCVAVFAMLALLSLLIGCSAYAADKASVEKALEANVSQAAVFHRHSSAFERVIRSAQMADELKAAVLELIEKDREAFDGLNRGVERAIGVLGALTLADLNAIADKLQELYRSVKSHVTKSSNSPTTSLGS
jgi:hypothetical protein